MTSYIKNCLIICGGKYAEHEVSIRSAQFIIQSLDENQYSPSIIIIAKNGDFIYLSNARDILRILRCSSIDDIELINEGCKNTSATNNSVERELCLFAMQARSYVFLPDSKRRISCDIAIPIVHGITGEDGGLQGILEHMGIPYLGSNVNASALCMNKYLTKCILQERKLPCLKYIALNKNDDNPSYNDAAKYLGSTKLFIKSSSNGSSIGCFTAINQEEFNLALHKVRMYDFKFLIEPFLDKIEIECAVIQPHFLQTPISSPDLGELNPPEQFYSYHEKYSDKSETIFALPANLPKNIIDAARDLAQRAFLACDCNGMARVDMFVYRKANNSNDGDLYQNAILNPMRIQSDDDLYYIAINELNTLPGMTSISLYPKMLEMSGISNQSLLDKLLNEAIERFKWQQETIKIPDDL